MKPHTALVFVAASMAAASAFASEFPAKPIRIIAQKKSQGWGQQVVVDNRPGCAKAD